MKKLLVAVAVAILSFALTPLSALADARTSRTERLGLDPSLDVQVAPLAAPSAAQPWGTVALAWHESTTSGSDLHVGEWDLGAGRMVRARVVRTEGPGLRAVRLARTGSALLVLSADLAGGPLELLRLDLDLRVQQRLALADGSLASLVADERFIAAGAFDGGAYRVQLIDARTFAVVATRTLTGDAALSPWPVPARSAHALRLAEGRLYVSLPDRDPRVVSLRLPSLTTEATMTFVIPAAHRWAYTSVPLDAVGSPLGFETPDDGHVLLAPDLQSFRKAPATTPPPWAPAEPQSSGERATTRAHGRTVFTGVRGVDWVIAVSM